MYVVIPFIYLSSVWKIIFGSYIKIKLLFINFEFILIKKMNFSLLMSFKREIQ